MFSRSWPSRTRSTGESAAQLGREILHAARGEIDGHARRRLSGPGTVPPGRAMCAVRKPFDAADRRSSLWAAHIMTSSGRRFSGCAQEIDGSLGLTGDHIRGSGGVRKLRWAAAGRGKRGGLRIIYYLRSKQGEIWLLTLYAKNEAESISGPILKKIKEEIDG